MPVDTVVAVDGGVCVVVAVGDVNEVEVGVVAVEVRVIGVPVVGVAVVGVPVEVVDGEEEVL